MDGEVEVVGGCHCSFYSGAEGTTGETKGGGELFEGDGVGEGGGGTVIVNFAGDEHVFGDGSRGGLVDHHKGCGGGGKGLGSIHLGGGGDEDVDGRQLEKLLANQVAAGFLNGELRRSSQTGSVANVVLVPREDGGSGDIVSGHCFILYNTMGIGETFCFLFLYNQSTYFFFLIIFPIFLNKKKTKKKKMSTEFQDTAAESTVNCTPEYEDTEALIEANEGALMSAMQAMNIESCTYQKSSGGAAGCYFPVGCGGAGWSEQSASGCESINVVSNMMNQVTSQLSCTLNQSSASLSSDASNQQTIEFSGGDVSGSIISASNTSSVKTNFVNLSQQSVQKEISNTISQGITNTISQAQSTNNEAYSDPTAQKQSASMLSNIQSVASDTTVQTSVANTALTLQSGQTIKIEVGKVTDSTITLTNDNCFDLVAQNFVYNTLAEIVQNSAVQTSYAALEQTQSQTNSGLSSLFSGYLTYIYIVFFLGAGSYVYFKYFKGKGGSANQSKQSKSSKPSQNTTIIFTQNPLNASVPGA